MFLEEALFRRPRRRFGGCYEREGERGESQTERKRKEEKGRDEKREVRKAAAAVSLRRMGSVKKYSEPRWPILKPAMYLLRPPQFPVRSCGSSERSFRGCGGHFVRPNLVIVLRLFELTGSSPAARIELVAWDLRALLSPELPWPATNKAHPMFPGDEVIVQSVLPPIPFLSSANYFDYELIFSFIYSFYAANIIKKDKKANALLQFFWIYNIIC